MDFILMFSTMLKGTSRLYGRNKLGIELNSKEIGMAQPFKIGINMAGAVSAGAYTAGVLDFLMEALEEWQTAKDGFRAFLTQPNSGSNPTPVPLHDTMIDVISGASAGGMCAAIASVMVQ
jgi:predicted acylesterase/phospholipase RssA